MSIPTLAADLAARIPSMAQDSPINNSSVIEGMIQNELQALIRNEEELLPWQWRQKCERLKNDFKNLMEAYRYDTEALRNRVASLRSTLQWMVEHTGGYERQLAKDTLKKTE